MKSNWLLSGARKDAQSITSDWELVNQELIEGVKLRQVKPVPKNDGYLTEVFRQEWGLDDGKVDQVFQVNLFPGEITSWHAHEHATDRLFVNMGQVKIVLYDSREDSPTLGRINEFRLGSIRPGLLIIPPKVWHGVQNVSPETSSLLNLVDQAYNYEDPDHWRVPPDSPEIPYAW